MEERRTSDSKWSDWLAILPKDWSDQAIFYTEEELLLLEGSQFATYIRNFRKELEADYNFISRNIPDFSSQYSLQEFLETYKSVQSRLLGLFDENRFIFDVMVPMADFFNH